MSSWAAETYPWLVRVNCPVLSNESVPITQYAAPLWISLPGSGPTRTIWLTSVPRAPQLALALRDLGHVVAVGGDAALGTGSASRAQPAAPHSSPSGIGPGFWATVADPEEVLRTVVRLAAR